MQSLLTLSTASTAVLRFPAGISVDDNCANNFGAIILGQGFIQTALDQYKLLAALTILIYRYTHQADFSIGYQRYGPEGALSLCHLGCELNDNMVVGELLAAATREVDKLAADQFITDDGMESSAVFLRSAEALQGYGLGVMHYMLPCHDELDAVTVEKITASYINALADVAGVIDRFMYILHIADGVNSALQVVFNYRFFSKTDAKRISKHLDILLNQMDDVDSRRAIVKLAMLADQELREQDQFLTGALKQFPDCRIYQYVERYAQSSPQSIALIYQSTYLTYSELNQKVNQLAHYLRQKKMVKGNRIAVFLRPSTDIIIAILAIHKLGCVYVPIDTEFPAERIQIILDDVCPAAIISAEEISVEKYNAIGINLKLIAAVLDAMPKENINCFVGLDDESHIFYTSGTTGKPKGVVSTHQNLIHYLLTAQDSYGFNRDDRFIALARFTFSISFFELLSPLVAGGTLKILPRDDILNMQVLAQHFQWATVFHIGPSLLKKVLPYIEENYVDYAVFSTMRHVSSGGDMVPPEVLEKLKNIFINAEVFVIYGSSEISCMGCRYFVSRGEKTEKSYVGKPHANVSLRVVDKYDNRVPVGVVGDIVFGGNGVVKGYLDRDELTAEKFFWLDDKRYYRIGDVGRIDEAGNLEMLGREDYQVQIKGIRVELGEVDYYLRQIPGVADAVAGTYIADNDNMLIGYLVPNANQDLDIQCIRFFLGKNLPDYLVPAKFIVLDSLPLNHNMKIERSRLPLPTYDNVLMAVDCIDAKDDVEENLILIWEGLFKLPKIGVNHTFFDLGGDSLLAVKLLAEIDRVFNKSIPIAFMLKNPTVSDMANLVRSKNNDYGVGDVVVLKVGNPAIAPLFCLYGVLHYKDLANSISSDQVVYGVYLQEEMNLLQDGGATAMDEFSNVYTIADKYLQRIISFQPVGPYYLAGHSFGGIVALEVARKIRESGGVVNLVAMLESWHPHLGKKIFFVNKLLLHFKKLCRDPISYFSERISKLRIKILACFFTKKKRGTSDVSINEPRDDARSRAIKNYRSAFYSGPVVIYRAKNKDPFEPDDPFLGWAGLMQEIDVQTIPGGHITMIKHPNVDKLASHVSQYLP
jgi:amino acid adenylation domain-containing protein